MEATVLDNDLDPRRRARALYWQGWRVVRIAEELDLPINTVHSWKYRDKWDETDPVLRVSESIEARLIQLVNKDAKEGKDFKEIDLLGRQMERLARVNKYSETGKEADLNPNIERRNDKPKRKPRRNLFTEEQSAKLKDLFLKEVFDYQRTWYEVGLEHRIRNILKSRQIGATYYFAREALLDAVENANNQIFLSASKAQAHVFKHYITQFAQQVDVNLSGDPIVLANGATFTFWVRIPGRRRVTTETCTSTNTSGCTSSRSFAKSPAAWRCTSVGGRPTSALLRQ